MLRSMKDLHGATIGASDGDIGTLTDCYFDDTSFTVRYIILETAGWLSRHELLVSPVAFRSVDWDGRRITATLTKAQVESSPEIDTSKPVSRQHEAAHFDHYGYPPYWTGPFLWGMSPYPYSIAQGTVTADDLAPERRWDWDHREHHDRHLQSAAAVTGYQMRALDGDVGHVRDFLVDDRSWAIPYLVVETTSWWPGERVLVAPTWVERLDWDHSQVQVSVTRAQIRDGAICVPDRSAGGGYELPGHHGTVEPHADGK